LTFLAQVLREKYGIDCKPNERYDLIHSESGLKLSGSASKLGRTNCYHHFTLLVDTDKEIMEAAIRRKQQDFVKTSSTLSKRSGVINLAEINSGLTVSQVINDLSQAYCRLYTALARPTSVGAEEKTAVSRDEFDSLNTMRLELEKHDWIYGMTPKFELEQSIKLLDAGSEKEAKMIVQVNRGKFVSIDIDCPITNRNFSDKFSSLIGTNFNYQEAMVNTAKILQLTDRPDGQLELHDALDQIFVTLLLKIIQGAHFE